MVSGVGFDNAAYLAEQSRHIRDRVERFHNKLYLEFGGKLLYDMHAARVLPGFDPNVKMRLLQRLKDQTDIILCIYAGDIERKKIRADFGITYDADAMKLIDDLDHWGLGICAVVITRYEDQPAATLFRNKLERRGVRVYTHRCTRGYPIDVDAVVSDEGLGQNPRIVTSKPLVVVTGPGPNSGKLSTCLSQLYHDQLAGVRAGYAKFETFPIWSLPLRHPVNVAYEAATVDIGDVNMVDPHHLEAHAETAVNYNRDVEIFPVVRRILQRISGDAACYLSPTEMGVNRAGFGIVDDAVVAEAARQEVIRRHFRYACEYALGLVSKDVVERLQALMDQLHLRPQDRLVVAPARAAAKQAQEAGKGNKGVYVGAALELRDGALVTGKNNPLMHAASSVVLNAVKRLAGIPDQLHLLAPAIMESVARLKEQVLAKREVSLNLEETLIALSISAMTNPAAEIAVSRLTDLRGCDMHLTHMPTPGDEAGLRRLGLHLTADPFFSSSRLFTD